MVSQSIPKGGSSAGIHGFPARSEIAHLDRREFFVGMLILGCANGFATRTGDAVRDLGWADALFATFNISAIVWISCFAGVFLVFQN